MARRTEEQNERRGQPRQEDTSSPSGSAAKKRRKPRGALFRGDDPTLAKRAEEELRTFGR